MWTRKMEILSCNVNCAFIVFFEKEGNLSLLSEQFRFMGFSFFGLNL